MELTSANTAIVLDSTADFPEARERFPSWRIVPLYVRFGEESYRDGVDLDGPTFYRRLAGAKELPTTSQPTPGDFAAAYADLGGYERIISLHLSGKLSGTVGSARIAAPILPNAACTVGENTRYSASPNRNCTSQLMMKNKPGFASAGVHWRLPFMPAIARTSATTPVSRTTQRSHECRNNSGEYMPAL